ncbi:MAG: hypothetical protein DHS20C18_50400 [Saprospiraceae bacterium]|nr:MAG: hypothetical protein DHS20C18_50400 [Saprospiraceae bacterium]
MNTFQKILQSKMVERLRRQVGKTTGLHLRLKRFTPSASEEMRTAMLLQHKGVDFVIDIGANTGQFAESLYDFGYTGKVVSFEPVGSVHEHLQQRSQSYPNWTVAERCAIGNQDGETQINVSNDSVFSSVLEIEDSYVSHNPKSKIVSKEKIKLYKIDTILPKYLPEDNSGILLKIDTQGFEKEVLDGAQETLAKAKGIKIEIPLYPIYRDTHFEFYDIIDFVKKHGFKPYSFHVEGVDLNTGRVNTIDGLFFRD